MVLTHLWSYFLIYQTLPINIDYITQITFFIRGIIYQTRDLFNAEFPFILHVVAIAAFQIWK